MSGLPGLRDRADAHDRGAADSDRPGALALSGFPAGSDPQAHPGRGPFRGLRGRQGKYWDQQHQRSTQGQPIGPLSGTPGTFRDYAKANGLDVAKYDACMESGKYAGRIEASSREGVAVGVDVDADLSDRRPALPGRHGDYDEIKKLVDSLSPAPAKLTVMKYRMAAALLSLAGFFVSLYLYLYKIGRIGTLACGTGGCETVQLSPYSRFLGLEVALYGVVGYLVLLVIGLDTLRRPARRRSALGLLLVLSGGGRRPSRSISPTWSCSSSTPSAAGAWDRRSSSP